jgi:hypothetical protein
MRCLNYTSAILTGLLSVSTTLSAQNVRPIYDARLDLKPTSSSTEEVNWLKNQVLPNARRHWQEQDHCEEGFSIMDVATGAFTQAKATQKAYLYQYCDIRSGVSNNGIAIVENKHVVADVMYEGSWNSALGALPDINHNGLSEILITDNFTGQGYSHGGISLVELASNRIKKLGYIQVSESNCGAVEQGGMMTAYKLYVTPATTPIFYRETFKQSCDTNDQWQKVGKRERVSLDKDETEYFLETE